VNKSLAVFALAVLAAAPAAAQSSASKPAMFDVEEVMLRPVHFGDEKSAETCALSADDLGKMVLKTLTDAGVPAANEVRNVPPIMGHARIYLQADVFTLGSGGLDCTSWVSLRAESHGSIHVPPVDFARDVNVTYWHSGSLMSSGQSTHERRVSDTLQKLAGEFAAQFKQDQSPTQP
jgi:hypothetical protein